MRIALISPYDDRAYGLRIIAATLRRAGHEVLFLVFKQFRNKRMTIEQLKALRHPSAGIPSPVTETLEEGTVVICHLETASEAEWQCLMAKLAEFRPELIGLTLTTPTAAAGREVTVRIKREFPNVPVIWGNVHPTIQPDECLQWADMVCIGEGEHSMLELAQDPERTDILGIWRRKDSGVIRNPVRPLEQDLDVFPFAAWGENEWIIDWNQLVALPPGNRRYFRDLYMTMSQRGCPFSCTYCANHVRKAIHKGERYVRRRSADHTIAECRQRAREFDLVGFAFMDDIFLKDREWLEEFAEKWPREVGLPFGGYAHPALTDKEMIRLLVGVGLRFVTLGVQSGSEYIACEVYNRRHGYDGILELAECAAEYGLYIVYEVLSNCDYESENDCLQTFKLLQRLPPPRMIQVKGLGVFPPLKIASLNLPKHCLPEETFEFWNLLYLMTRHREIPAEQLSALIEDPCLKTNPEPLRAMALALKETDARTRSDREEIERLKAQQADTTLEGLLRYSKRLAGRVLPHPVVETIKSVRARFRTALARR